jgi:hypothetical protein
MPDGCSLCLPANLKPADCNCFSNSPTRRANCSHDMSTVHPEGMCQSCSTVAATLDFNNAGQPSHVASLEFAHHAHPLRFDPFEHMLLPLHAYPADSGVRNSPAFTSLSAHGLVRKWLASFNVAAHPYPIAISKPLRYSRDTSP